MRNPSAERPSRLDICIERPEVPLWLVEVLLGILELEVAVMLVHCDWTFDGIVKVDERVKSMHYTRGGR